MTASTSPTTPAVSGIPSQAIHRKSGRPVPGICPSRQRGDTDADNSYRRARNGRSVRGEKDYCIVVVVGAEFIRLIRVRNRASTVLADGCSNRAGVENCRHGRQEIEDGESPVSAFNGFDAQWPSLDEGLEGVLCGTDG